MGLDAPNREPEADAATLLAIVRELCRELGRPFVEPTLDSAFAEDLGIDSLGRLELLLRLQRALPVDLPDEVALRASTPRELLAAMAAAEPAPEGAPSRPRPRAVEPLPVDATLPDEAGTLLHVLDFHAERTPGRVHLTLLDGERERDVTWAELRWTAAGAARRLAALGVSPGDRVALMLPTSVEYFGCFFGVLLAGAVPVPLYPPARPGEIAGHVRRHGTILKEAETRVLVTTRAIDEAGGLSALGVPGLERVAHAEELCGGSMSDAGAEAAPLPRRDPTDVALVQYTSGSTDRPKGVVLSQASILANVRAIGKAEAVTSADVVVSWLPLYHDMGLIGAWLVSLYHNARFVVMPPQAFLVRPERWLRAIHDHRGTLTTAPNFAYEICARRLDDAALEGLDLSSLRMALNGAEPVRPRTLERFTARFAPHGLRPEALSPVYGLAENCVALTMTALGVRARVDTIDRQALQADGLAKPLGEGTPGALEIVGCGRAIPGHEVRIAGTSGETLEERRQGRVQFRGPSATSGYLGHSEATAALRDGEWLETGDLGYLADGELHVTGRVKDLVIRAGRNLHPQEMEEAVGEVAGVRKGCVAAFGSEDEGRGTERVVVAAETRLTDAAERAALIERIRAALLPILDGHPDDIVLLSPRSIPKTSSGKIRRRECRVLYESGRLGTAAGPLLRLARAARGGAALARAAARRLGEYTYAARGLLAVHTMRVVMFLGLNVLPGVPRRRRFLRRLMHAYYRAAGIPVVVEGRERLLAEPCMAVANHQSYLDTILMTSVVSEAFFFTPKRDLENDPVARRILGRLDHQFVDRLDPETGVRDLEAVKARLRGGESVVVYPEGIFYPEPGLRQFYMGAFVVAAETGTPVVPVAIRGARAVWRGETYLPFFRRGSVSVTVLPAVRPEGTDFRAAAKLRAEVRRRILEHCGEFDACA